MTTSIERFAEIIWNAQHPLVPDLTWDEISIPGKWIDVQEALDAARAVVAVLPTADVSDEAIREACHGSDTVAEGLGRNNAVRALLGAQAAAHAAEVDWKVGAAEARERAAVAEVKALRAEVERARGDAKAWLDERGNVEWQAMVADRDAYRARIDAVRALRRRWLLDYYNTPDARVRSECANELRAALGDA